MFKGFSSTQHFAQQSLMFALGLMATSAVFANPAVKNQSEPIYNYLPAEELKVNVESALSANQIDVSNLDIQVDEKGVVNASGNVESKQQADNITKIIKDTQSVYMVFGRFVYPQTEQLN
jgi:osmotically-inducible protein OsmY